MGSPDTDTSAVSPAQARALQSQPAVPIPVANPRSADYGPDVTINGKPVSETPRRLQYELTATARATFDDNVFNSSIQKTSDFYFTIEPNIHVWLGSGDTEGSNSLSLTYAPGVFLFADNSQLDTVQHLIRLLGAHAFGHLSLSLSQDVRLLDGTDLNSLADPNGHQANTDVSGRTKHQIYTTQLSGSYDLTGKLYLSADGNFFADEYSSSLISSRNFGGDVFLNYRYSDKLVVGAGGTGGYNTVSGGDGGDQTFEQANLRIGYSATAKISISGSVGVEFRQFSGISGTNVDPVYTLSANYTPFDGTGFSLTGSKQTYNSASLAGQDYSDTTINLAFTQRFLQRFFVGLAVGYTNSSYFSTTTGINATRDDNFYYIDPSIDFNITRYWSAGVYYVHRENSSSLQFFGFNDDQVGFRTRLTF